MGPKYTQSQWLMLLVVCGSMVGASVAVRDSFHCTDPARKIVVGGTNWTFGFDYTAWALKNSPFFINDSLVFKYDMPKDNTTHPHSVYLLPDEESLEKCDLSKGVMVADGPQGGGEGFEFVLKKRQPYYFACAGGEGIHCNLGKMKFAVQPSIRYS